MYDTLEAMNGVMMFNMNIDMVLTVEYRHRFEVWRLLAPPSSSCGGLGAPRTIMGAFGPLFGSRRCKTKHTQFSIKIGPIGEICIGQH